MAEAGVVSQEEKTIWRYQAINTLTGEVVELGQGDTPRKRWKTPRVQLFQASIARIAQEGQLSKEGWRVLGHLLSVLDWDNWLVIPQTEIAWALDMSRPQVSRAIRILVSLKILREAGKPYPRSAYRLNSEFAYKGKYNGWQKRQREEREERDALRRRGAELSAGEFAANGCAPGQPDIGAGGVSRVRELPRRRTPKQSD